MYATIKPSLRKYYNTKIITEKKIEEIWCFGSDTFYILVL